MDVLMIPLEAIDADSLVRDRAVEDEAAAAELRLSIGIHGLRMPIEVYELSKPEGPLRYGLISGRRRLSAYRWLAGSSGAESPNPYASIPAFLRAPKTLAHALEAMVEENDVRAGLSSWEQGRIAVAARDVGAYATLDAAVAGLYATAGRQKRSRLRAIAGVVEALEPVAVAPETLSLRQIMRLAGAISAGYGELIDLALDDAPRTAEAQWAAVLPILTEAETLGEAHPTPAAPGCAPRPRRLLTPRRGLTIRREMTPEGWNLRFTGPQARGELMDRVFDEIERMFAPQ